MATQKPVFVYRGVHREHPMLEPARRGVVIPGNPNGELSPDLHNAGAQGDIARSPYTSWTYSKEEAFRKAADRGGGYVVLRLEKTDPSGMDTWTWVESPNIYEVEEEILLLGIRTDCEVIHGA